ncbi:hypothetical protein [Epilithonimonas mollis]|uniref:Uncharacterized protein n=1 Tax=Epilithonimonas mollis TaxID=216903 RepID=A0A1M6SK13_9FLAO|nr:hypothetical protein [Epilithonimonas mollis]SHK44986.1 hypothetical protein SAMN05444371_2502 [Epilithonimonas mollis]
MIPPKMQALFDFLDFLDVNKKEYIEKYIPLCNEVSQLDKERCKLKPNENYKDKQKYECIDKEIKEKFEPINENIYIPITYKLRELGIWSGDNVYTSIWNNNVSEIEDFKRNFTPEDLEEVFHYKQKYLRFRTETNNDFLCLSFVFSNLDEIYKVLFDFFKDTPENEFESFETKTIEVGDFGEIVKNLTDNIGKNVKYSIPTEKILGKKQATRTTERIEAKNHFNVFNMGDKIEVGNISNNKGQITLGKDNKTEVNSNDEIAKKSFRWQKRDTIITTVIGIIGLLIAYLSMKN